MFDHKRFSSILKKATLHGNKLTTELLHRELERRNVDINIETLKSYRKGNIKNPSFKILDEIALIADCTVQDFLENAEQAREKIAIEEITSSPNKYSDSLYIKEPALEYMRDIQTNSNYLELPTIHAGAGAIGYAVDLPERRAFPKDLIPPNIALDENILAIVVAGNSMEPLYYENDIVFIDMVNGREFTPVDGTYLVRYGDTVQIKDVSFIGNGDIMISSRNNPERIKIKADLGIDDWEIVGKPYVQLHATVGSKLLIEKNN